MTCQRMGRQNLLQAHEDKTSNLVAHLKVNQHKINVKKNHEFNLMSHNLFCIISANAYARV